MASASKKVGGRPATISRDQIADAVAAMPAEQVSMRAVAARLGVSISSLYHWVDGREDMLRLAGERSLAQFTPPEDHGQHWSQWLLEWGQHIHRAFTGEPRLMRQFADGTLSLPRMLESMDTAMGLLVRQGFTEVEALQAFHLISQQAVGASLAQVREDTLQVEGHPFEHEYRRLLTRHPADELPHLRRLASLDAPMTRDLDADLRVLLVGLAVSRGEELPQ